MRPLCSSKCCSVGAEQRLAPRSSSSSRRMAVAVSSRRPAAPGACHDHLHCHEHDCPAESTTETPHGQPSSSAAWRTSAAVASASTAWLIGSVASAMESVAQPMVDASDELAVQVAAALAAGTYTPSPMEGPGWEIWVGFVAGVIPFAIGSWEFAKRILIQLRCEECDGKGLVRSTREGTKYVRKCAQCGGFFPWVSWKLFLTSTAAPGNGGPLQYPKGQTSVFFKVPPPRPPKPTERLIEVPMTATAAAAAGEGKEVPGDAGPQQQQQEQQQP